MIEDCKNESHENTSKEDFLKQELDEENHHGEGLERLVWPSEMRAIANQYG